MQLHRVQRSAGNKMKGNDTRICTMYIFRLFTSSMQKQIQIHLLIFRLFTSDTQAFSSALPWIALITSSMCWRLSTGIFTLYFFGTWKYRWCFGIHQRVLYRYVEVLDKYFGSVCELDIIFNFEKAYFILDELILGGEMQVRDYRMWNTEYGIPITEYGIQITAMP